MNINGLRTVVRLFYRKHCCPRLDDRLNLGRSTRERPTGSHILFRSSHVDIARLGPHTCLIWPPAGNNSPSPHREQAKIRTTWSRSRNARESSSGHDWQSPKNGVAERVRIPLQTHSSEPLYACVYSPTMQDRLRSGALGVFSVEYCLKTCCGIFSKVFKRFIKTDRIKIYSEGGRGERSKTCLTRFTSESRQLRLRQIKLYENVKI